MKVKSFYVRSSLCPICLLNVRKLLKLTRLRRCQTSSPSKTDSLCELTVDLESCNYYGSSLIQDSLHIWQPDQRSNNARIDATDVRPTCESTTQERTAHEGTNQRTALVRRSYEDTTDCISDERTGSMSNLSNLKSIPSISSSYAFPPSPKLRCGRTTQSLSVQPPSVSLGPSRCRNGRSSFAQRSDEPTRRPNGKRHINVVQSDDSPVISWIPTSLESAFHSYGIAGVPIQFSSHGHFAQRREEPLTKKEEQPPIRLHRLAQSRHEMTRTCRQSTTRVMYLQNKQKKKPDNQKQCPILTNSKHTTAQSSSSSCTRPHVKLPLPSIPTAIRYIPKSRY